MAGPESDHMDEDVLLQMDVAFPEAPANAKTLTIKELTKELETRDMRPTGFYAEDLQALQNRYDEEYQDKLTQAQARREEFLLQKQRAREVAKQQEKELLELREEERALKHHARAASWIKMLASSRCPEDMQLAGVTPPLLRALCRPLAHSSAVCSLDLSSSKLDEGSGSILAIALCKNTSIKRVELENCQLGPSVAEGLAKVLEENQTIAHLSLESNPLTGADRDTYDGLNRFLGALARNTTLLLLNLWRTGLGERGGNIVAKHLKSNKTLLAVGVGCNGISTEAERDIHSYLARNAELKATRDRAAKSERDKRSAQQEEVRLREERERKRVEENEWLERRKVERRVARERAKQEEADRLAEVERQRLEAVARAEEEERLRQEAKKKKKKKKGGKKKK